MIESGKGARLAALDAAIDRGLADLRAGRTRAAEEVFDRLETKYREVSERREGGG